MTMLVADWRRPNLAIIVNIPGVVKLALEVDEVLEIGDIDAQSIVRMPAKREDC